MRYVLLLCTILSVTVLTSFETSAVSDNRTEVEQLKMALNDMRAKLDKLNEKLTELDNQCIQLAQGVSIQSTSRPIGMELQVHRSQIDMKARELEIDSDKITITGKILTLKADTIIIDGEIKSKTGNDTNLKGSIIKDN